MWDDVRRGLVTGWALRAVLLTTILSGLALGAAWMLPEPEAHAALPAQVHVAGERVELNGEPSQLAARVVADYLDRTLRISAGASEHVVSRRQLGVRVDAAHLAALLADASDARSSLRRVHERVLGDRPLQLPMPAELEVARTSQLLTRLKDLVDRPAIEPRIEPRARQVVPARSGVELDVYGTLERIDAALRSGRTAVQASLRTVAPKHSTESLERVDIRAQLGQFETRYNRGEVSEDRTHNLRTAASKLDGYVLEPGQVFDFNAAVGDRTETNGFRPAPVIADGELVDGMGGGTCQVASTLHAAVLFAGLPILTRQPHSRPSFYIKLGLDAAVVYGAQNFRFQNDRPYPVVLGVRVDEGRVLATVHGPERDRQVFLARKIDDVLPFEERVVLDPALPSGLRVLEQRGVPGFKVTRFRVIQDLKTQAAVRERTSDSYPPTPQLWRVGTGREPSAGYERPRNDAHPEYVADEYLQMTQTERGTVDLIREAGRSGTYGWIEREGLVLRKP